MKTKLLRKLRKHAAKVYQVSKFFDGYYVVKLTRYPVCLWWDKTVIEKVSKFPLTLEESVKSCDSCRNHLILSLARSYRSKKKYAKFVY